MVELHQPNIVGYTRRGEFVIGIPPHKRHNYRIKPLVDLPEDIRGSLGPDVLILSPGIFSTRSSEASTSRSSLRADSGCGVFPRPREGPIPFLTLEEYAVSRVLHDAVAKTYDILDPKISADARNVLVKERNALLGELGAKDMEHFLRFALMLLEDKNSALFAPVVKSAMHEIKSLEPGTRTRENIGAIRARVQRRFEEKADLGIVDTEPENVSNVAAALGLPVTDNMLGALKATAELVKGKSVSQLIQEDFALKPAVEVRERSVFE